MSAIIRRSDLFVVAATLVGLTFTGAANADSLPVAVEDGIVKVRSIYTFSETVERLQADIRGKGIIVFSALDQAKLAHDAGIALPPSTLLTFGNPALGAQFLTSNAASGLDWPVRLLVVQDASGTVWAEYTDFAWIARRHHIADRDAAFQMASKVIVSITSAVQTRSQ